jgi:hypothetical protein
MWLRLSIRPKTLVTTTGKTPAAPPMIAAMIVSFTDLLASNFPRSNGADPAERFGQGYAESCDPSTARTLKYMYYAFAAFTDAAKKGDIQK